MVNWDRIKEYGWELKNKDQARILSLDGGGIRGIYIAQLLAEIEKDTGKSIHSFFDLIVGTSTGGIIALALSIGIPAQEIVELYMDNSKKIFKPLHKLFFKKIPYASCKYDNSGLQELVKQKFKEKKLKDAMVMLCITSVEHRNAEPKVYKTPHNEKIHVDGEKEMWKVAMVTSAAPTYFPASYEFADACNLDGGLWANNPVMVGILEALDNKCSLEKIKVLSIGTGENPYNIQNDVAAYGNLLRWKSDFINLFMNVQTRAAHNSAKYLIKDNLTRIDFLIQKEYCKIDLDSTDKKSLQELKRNASYDFQCNYRNGENIFEKFFKVKL